MVQTGDKIVITKVSMESYAFLNIAETYEVLGVNHNNIVLILDKENNSRWLSSKDEFVIYKHKFKVGDKVIASKNATGAFTKGKTYIVMDINGPDVVIECDDEGRIGNCWYMDNFELHVPKKKKRKKKDQFDCLRCDEELYPKPVCTCKKNNVFKVIRSKKFHLRCEFDDPDTEDIDPDECNHCCSREHDNGNEYCRHCGDMV